MEESTRISRGKISELNTLNTKDFDALIFPGGFGNVKNLSTYALEKNPEEFKVNPNVERVIKEFHAQQKYIALICSSPILAAKVLGTANGGPGLKLTFGHKPYIEYPYTRLAKKVATKLGNEVVSASPLKICHDEKNKVISTPAYMKDTAAINEVFIGITKLVNEIAKHNKKQ